MIRTDREYEEAKRRLEEDRAFIDSERKRFAALGLELPQIEKALEPLISFHEQLKEEVDWYERVRRGEFTPLHDIEDIGLLLVGLRIFSGLTQRELAEKLGISEAQVSRDERNEYHGITVHRAQKVLDVLLKQVEARLEIRVEMGKEEREAVPA